MWLDPEVALMTRDEEHRLIRDTIAGDRAATESLVRSHQASVFNYISKLSGKHHVAEDVVQEAFLRALTNLDKFDTRFRFSTWLFTIARRVYLNHAQKMAPRSNAEFFESIEGEDARPSGESPAPESVCASSLDIALQQLPFVQRNILVLFYSHDATITSIAEQLGLPEGTVKSHLHRGRMLLRELLDAQERAAMEARP